MLDTSHSTMAEGTDVGIIGGLAVAVWFLILDTIAGHPFQTPSLLGQVVLFGDARPDTSQLVFGAILVYTAFHFAVFALLGMGLVVLVHWAVRDSVVRYALLPVFLVFEVMFYGLLEVLSGADQHALPVLGGCRRQHPGRLLYGALPLGPPPRFPPFHPGDSAGRRPAVAHCGRTFVRRSAPPQITFQPHLTSGWSVRHRVLSVGLLAPHSLLVRIAASGRSWSRPPPAGPWRWTRSSGCWDTTSGS